MEDGFKICPFCKEKIRQEAVKCRFCGEWLEKDKHPSAFANKIENSPSLSPLKSEFGIFSKVRKIFHGKTLLWISISLLITSGVFWFWELNQFDPTKQGEAVTNIISGLIKILFVAALVSWGTKGKLEKLFAFSTVLAIVTLIVACYSYAARHEAQQKAQELNKIYANNINSIEEFVKNGANGEVPEFKPTGDADSDTFFQSIRGFYTDYFQGWRRASADIQALQEMNVFDCAYFTNKLYFEPQIQSRIEGQQIIEAFETNAFSMLENFKQQCAALKVTEEYKQGVLKGLDKLSPQFEVMFAASMKSQKSDQMLLQFLYDNFGNYELKDGAILFVNTADKQKYTELANDVQNASAEIEELQKHGMANLEAAKTNLLQADK